MRVKKVARHLIDFCYPGACAACDDACDGDSPLCGRCGDQLRTLEASSGCARCAMPVARLGAPCPRCLGKGLYPFDFVLRLAPFRDPLKHLIHQTKYHRKWPLAEFLADRLLAQGRINELLTAAEALVPVPLHRRRQIARGYNQADVLARRVASKCKGSIVRPVVRLRNTETQTHQSSREKRTENLRDAFGLVRAEAISGKHVVVIDDVMTTGATLQSLGRTLLAAKPASLCAVIVAIADPRGRDFETI